MSETTHLICAHCGGDNAMSNAVSLVGDMLMIIPGFGIIFRCQHCHCEYSLPSTDIRISEERKFPNHKLKEENILRGK